MVKLSCILFKISLWIESSDWIAIRVWVPWSYHRKLLVNFISTFNVEFLRYFILIYLFQRMENLRFCLGRKLCKHWWTTRSEFITADYEILILASFTVRLINLIIYQLLIDWSLVLLVLWLLNLIFWWFLNLLLFLIESSSCEVAC